MCEMCCDAECGCRWKLCMWNGVRLGLWPYLVLRDVVVVCGRLRCNVMSDCVM